MARRRHGQAAGITGGLIHAQRNLICGEGNFTAQAGVQAATRFDNASGRTDGKA